jgi:hypothetical protein
VNPAILSLVAVGFLYLPSRQTAPQYTYLPASDILAWQFTATGPGLIKTSVNDTVEVVFLRDLSPPHRLDWLEGYSSAFAVLTLGSGRPRVVWYEDESGLRESLGVGDLGSLLVPRMPLLGQSWWWTSDSLRRVVAIRDTLISGEARRIVEIEDLSNGRRTDLYRWVSGYGLVFYEAHHPIDYLPDAEYVRFRRIGMIYR